ncbi:transcriptional regulator, MarR family [Solidesulfovibrio fructosivorans JJ]]|uniref:Transcriptional regulator, MarR family n=1 Tax=Solidesulfovibrio fructosivorans JJ] TaxID=596151 RepID=E1JRF2_SOLFR|nr:MarR family transcriptional regulator [Solidesulfovibrio fructosivorans]EFL53153.1 transcriptional regulator, MarR family [Solidesulfovibrio fructosivorans JJ]]
MSDDLNACARELLEVMPLVMQDLRQTMRSHSAPDLRVPELRSMAFLRHFPGSNLTDLAEYIGVSLPSMSKLVDALAYRGFVERKPDPSDRRRVRLSLTEEGANVLSKAREAVKAKFATRLARLTATDITLVTTGMALLRELFTNTGAAPGAGEINQPASENAESIQA